MMTNRKSIAEIFSLLKKNKFLLNVDMALGYAPGLPMLKTINGKTCIQLLFWKCVVTGEKNKNYVYPVRYVATFTYPELMPIEFVDLKYAEKCLSIEFNKPVGLFPHKALLGINKKTYTDLKNNFYLALDKVLANEQKDSNELAEYFTKLLEPSLKPIYQLVNPDFIKKYYIAN